MKTEQEIKSMLDEAKVNMEQSRVMFGKEVFQKRFKPIFEGYMTALCTVIDMDEESRTDIIKGKINENN